MLPCASTRTPANRPRSQGTPGEERDPLQRSGHGIWGRHQHRGDPPRPVDVRQRRGRLPGGSITEPDQTGDRDRTYLAVAGCGPGAPPPGAVVLDGARLVADRLRGGFVNDQLVVASLSTGFTTAITRSCRTRRDSSTTRTAGSADSPPASPPTPPGGRAP